MNFNFTKTSASIIGEMIEIVTGSDPVFAKT